MRRQPHNELALSSPAVRGRFAADVSDAEEGLLRFPIDSASCESVAWVPAEIADMFFQCCLVVSSVRLSAQIILSMFVFMLNGEVPTFYTIQHAHNPRQRNGARLFSIWRRRWCPLVRQWVLSEVCKFTMWFIISSTPTGLDISFPRLILSTQLGKPSLQFLPNDEPTMCDINILEDAISIVEGNYPWPGLHFHFDRFLQRSLITSRCVFVFRPQESLIPILQLRTGPGSGFHLQRGAACWCGHDWTREKGSSTSPLLWEKWLVYTWAAKLTNHVLRFTSVKRRYTEKHEKKSNLAFSSCIQLSRSQGSWHLSFGPRDRGAQNLQITAT